MGLLDSTDDEVKNHVKYKNVLTAIKGMEGALGRYKEAGGDDKAGTSLAMAVVNVFKKLKEGRAQFGSYKGWDELAKDANELAAALKEKHPEDRYVKQFADFQ
jgi:molybdenum-dependent DNA-binding transcriptional regulator ModE